MRSTVDVAHLEERCFGAANARGVEHHQDGAVQQVGRRLDQAGDFLRAQHDRQLSGIFGKIRSS